MGIIVLYSGIRKAERKIRENGRIAEEKRWDRWIMVTKFLCQVLKESSPVVTVSVNLIC
jgi:hypothetical protein